MKRLVFAAVALFLAAGCLLLPTDRFDPISGELSGMGVKAPVTVARDKFGIAHIRAENAEDLFFAAGYAMAQDRFMMMDLLRRAASGRLSELLGSPAKYGDFDLPRLDIGLRAFRFEEAAKKGVAELDPENRRLLEAFTRGINRFLQDGGDTLAIYRAWKVPPTPWRMEDSFLSADVMGLSMTITSFFEEYYLERIRMEQGDTVRDLFVPRYPDSAAIITRDEPIAAAAFFPRAFGLGSNNWAVAGSRTVSGLPLLNNDPHVPDTLIPTFWWHCQLEGGGYDIMGLMFPAIPTFGAATTGKLGWALTNVMADYIDIWREKVNPANPNEYKFEGKWKPFTLETGEVRVKGGRTVKYTRRVSAHGVVIDEKLLGWKVAHEPGEVLVMRYVDLDHARFFRGYQAMARAKNFDEWLKGAEDESWGPYAWNHVYADAEGNIAYWASGHIPIRKDNQGYIARRGWEVDQEWQGYVPFADNPRLVNPKKGYLASANNRAEVPGYPYYITVDYAGPSRAERISRLIEAKPKLDTEDMKRIQYDVVDLSAATMVPIVLADLAGAAEPDLKLAGDLLREFQAAGYSTDADSRGTVVYSVFMVMFVPEVFVDEIGEAITRNAGNLSLYSAALEKIIADSNSPWFDDRRTPERETRRELTRRAMLEALKYCRQKLGADPAKWRWGDLSRLNLSPSIVSIPGVTKKYARGPFPLPGTGETVRAGDQLFLGRYGFQGALGPSTHFIVDFQHPRQALFNCSAGMSDNPQSARYDNLTADWLAGKYQTMSMDEADWRPGMMGEVVFLP
jgi:penicillin amidase